MNCLIRYNEFPVSHTEPCNLITTDEMITTIHKP